MLLPYLRGECVYFDFPKFALMRPALLLLTFFALTLSCSTETKTLSEKYNLAWLVGSWENRNSRGIIYETWQQNGDHEFTGRSYTVKQGDTSLLETIQLIEIDDTLRYIPTVVGQNGDESVVFTASEIGEYTFSFVDPTHDFPQMISYQFIAPDSMIAEISGQINGTELGASFRYRRMP